MEQSKLDVFELLKKSVRPEFLNRIDEIIMFEPLSRKIIRQIVDIQWKEVQDRMEANGIEIDASGEVKDYLGTVGFDPQYGARPLKRIIQKLILNELSKEILSGKISKDSVVYVSIDENSHITFENINEQIME